MIVADVRNEYHLDFFFFPWDFLCFLFDLENECSLVVNCNNHYPQNENEWFWKNSLRWERCRFLFFDRLYVANANSCNVDVYGSRIVAECIDDSQYRSTRTCLTFCDDSRQVERKTALSSALKSILKNRLFKICQYSTKVSELYLNFGSHVGSVGKIFKWSKGKSS